MIDIPGSLDRRAWDGAIEGAGLSIRVDAETAIRDAQSLLRRLALKQRDSVADRIVLAVSDTERNRAALRLAPDAFASSFPYPARVALRDLRSGRAPRGNTVLVL